MRDWIAVVSLIAALISLSANAMNLIYANKRFNVQEEKIEKLEGCSGVIPNISEPTKGEEVGSEVNIMGTSTIHGVSIRFHNYPRRI